MTATVLRSGSRLSMRVRRRSVVVVAAALLAVIVVGVLALTLGTTGIAPARLLPVMFGAGEGRETIVYGVLRGPRLFVGIAAGAAFGVAGALLQTVTRNPLGSPDVIGLTGGASAGAAAVALVWPGILPVPLGALLGALVAVGLVWLGSGRGFASPSRMLIVGIGVAAMSLAFVQYALTQSRVEAATILAAYLNGSLQSRSWDHVAIIWAAIAVLIPLTLLLSRRLQLLEMGDEQADALGARSTQARSWAVLASIALCTAAVSVVGPVAFIALTAPQIARRLTRAAGPNLVASAALGAVLLVLADLLTQQLPIGVQLPVGIKIGRAHV